MSPTRQAERHLDVQSALDYLELRMDAPRRPAVEDHLGRPCNACRELVRELGWLVESMRLDRMPEVPDSVRERALRAYEPRPATRLVERIRSRRARLLFDSRVNPLPTAVRRSLGETRRLRFALGSTVLELETEIESPEAITIRGRLHAPDPSLHRVEVVVRRERLSTRPDVDGAFVLDHVPAGRARLTVMGLGDRYRIPLI